MAEFRMTIEAVWESDGYFEEYAPLVKSEDKVTTKIVRTRKARGRKNKFIKKEDMSEDENNDNEDEEMSEEGEEEEEEEDDE